MFKKIGIIYKETLSFDADVSPHIETILSHSKDLYFHESASDVPDQFPKLSKDELGDQSDLIIVFGGDGTMLSTARDFIGYDLLIMGVNFGQVGFLTDSSENSFQQSIDDVFNNNFKLEERSFVKAEFDKTEIFGLNEIVLHSGSYAQMMK
jgi:Predicted sugar kinase